MATNEATMEYPVNIPVIPTEEEQDNQIEGAGQRARVSFLDPDFLCFALPLAATFDALGFVTAISIAITLGTDSPFAIVFLLIMDIIAMVIIGGWMYWRTNRIAQAKEEKKKEIQENLNNIQKRLQAMGKESSEEVGKIATKNTEKMVAKDAEKILAREATEEASKVATRASVKTGAKRIIAGSLGKILLRTGIKTAADASVIGILINLIPFWTITVLETLKEK